MRHRGHHTLHQFHHGLTESLHCLRNLMLGGLRHVPVLKLKPAQSALDLVLPHVAIVVGILQMVVNLVWGQCNSTVQTQTGVCFLTLLQFHQVCWSLISILYRRFKLAYIELYKNDIPEDTFAMCNFSQSSCVDCFPGAISAGLQPILDFIWSSYVNAPISSYSIIRTLYQDISRFPLNLTFALILYWFARPFSPVSAIGTFSFVLQS